MKATNIKHYIYAKLFITIFFINNCEAGIDLYSGPLSRYHTGKWECLTEQYAKAHGKTYKVIRPSSQTINEHKKAKDEDVLKLTIGWKNNLIKSLAKYGHHIKDWQESFDAPYNTKQIFLKLFDYIDQYEKETGQELSQLQLEYWIPYNKNEKFEGGDVINREIFIGTSQGMIEDIDKLAKHFFKKPIEKLIEEYNQIKSMKDEDQFKAQLIEIYQIADWSLKNNFPMKLDY